MSTLNATIWFRDKPDCEQLAAGFGLASQRLRMPLSVSWGLEGSLNSRETWSKAISRFADYEYSGSVTWTFQDGKSVIKGKVSWPIVNPGNIPGTIEFKVRWRDRQDSECNNFNDIATLVELLYDLSFAVRASSLLVEPSRLPADIADERYLRFKRLNSTHSLTSVDWISGVRSSNELCSLLKESHGQLVPHDEKGDFAIFVLAPEPFDYKRDEDRLMVKSLEIACKLA